MMYQQPNPLDDIKRFFKRSSVLRKLIVINIGVFILVSLVNLFYWLLQMPDHPEGMSSISIAAYYLAVPANLSSLLMRPWTLLTYMFLHEGFFHIFFNLMVLYFGGRIFMEYMNDRKLLSTYLLGGLAGAIFYIAAFNIFPVFDETLQYSVAMGASASVLAVLVAVSTFVPEYSVVLFLFGRVKLKYLALAVILIDLLSIQSGNAGGHIAHLGGAFWGFVYVTMLKKGNDFSINFGTMNFKKFFKYFTKPAKQTTTGSPNDLNRPITDDEYNFRRKLDQEQIDKILEKISRSGYSSLSKEEKAMLFQSSKKQH
ncbi:MAG: rhomboid family intramembrane serine protease [Clostridia bacterium]|nr:rhomboid family intramembrane serine protease [Clostridia bacterium]